MSRNWSLALVVAFVLGFGVKSYLDGQNKSQEQHAAKQEFSATTLFGKDTSPRKSLTKPMTEFVSSTSVSHVVQMSALLLWRC